MVPTTDGVPLFLDYLESLDLLLSTIQLLDC